MCGVLVCGNCSSKQIRLPEEPQDPSSSASSRTLKRLSPMKPKTEGKEEDGGSGGKPDWSRFAPSRVCDSCFNVTQFRVEIVDEENERREREITKVEEEDKNMRSHQVLNECEIDDII